MELSGWRRLNKLSVGVGRLPNKRSRGGCHGLGRVSVKCERGLGHVTWD